MDEPRAVRLVGGPFEGQYLQEPWGDGARAVVREFDGETGEMTREGAYVLVGDEAIYQTVVTNDGSFGDVR